MTRTSVAITAIVALALGWGACGARKHPDIQPTAPQPAPFGPGDPRPLPLPTVQIEQPDANMAAVAMPEPTEPADGTEEGSPHMPNAGEDYPRPPEPLAVP